MLAVLAEHVVPISIYDAAMHLAGVRHVHADDGDDDDANDRLLSGIWYDGHGQERPSLRVVSHNTIMRCELSDRQSTLTECGIPSERLFY